MVTYPALGSISCANDTHAHDHAHGSLHRSPTSPSREKRRYPRMLPSRPAPAMMATSGNCSAFAERYKRAPGIVMQVRWQRPKLEWTPCVGACCAYEWRRSRIPLDSTDTIILSFLLQPEIIVGTQRIIRVCISIREFP